MGVCEWVWVYGCVGVQGVVAHLQENCLLFVTWIHVHNTQVLLLLKVREDEKMDTSNDTRERNSVGWAAEWVAGFLCLCSWVGVLQTVCTSACAS